MSYLDGPRISFAGRFLGGLPMIKKQKQA